LLDFSCTNADCAFPPLWLVGLWRQKYVRK
jgi:hypothetical protein